MFHLRKYTMIEPRSCWKWEREIQSLSSVQNYKWFLVFCSLVIWTGVKWINCSIWRKWQPTPVFFPRKSYGQRSLVQATVHGVTKSWTRLSDFTLTFHFHALEKEMATHSSVLAWRIPGTGEPGGLPSMGSHRVEHDWSDLAVAAASWWIFYSWLVYFFYFH